MKASLEPGWSLLFRTSIGIALAALATVVCLRIPGINATTAGFVYLIVVLGVAARCGFTESVIVSVAADLAFNFFFFHPVSTFTVADPQNWIALAAFLLTAVSVTTFRREEAEAIELLATHNSKYVGRALRDIRFPRGAIVGAIARSGGTVVVPRGDVTIRAGDQIIFFALERVIPELEASF